MTDNVKFIFKTLLKVPIIIMVSFAIFNIIAVANTYLKILGFSYVVMQVGMENNYIPPTEQETLVNYLNSMETNYLTIDYDWPTSRAQYGTPVEVTITGNFKIIWPLMPTDQLTDTDADAVQGWGGTAGTYASDAVLESRRERTLPISVGFVVPGLKYYPDMA